MTFAEQLLTKDCRWQDGDGNIAASVGQACQIVNNPDAPGDNPFLFCQSSIHAGGERQYLPILAKYTPNNETNSYSFYSRLALRSGDFVIEDELTSPTSIYSDALEIVAANHVPDLFMPGTKDLYLWFVRSVQPHCERLAFVSNMTSSADVGNSTKLSGWIQPGGRYGEANRNLAPTPFGEITTKRTVVPNINYSLNANAGVEQPTGGSGWIEPGFGHPAPGAERWTYAPSMLARQNDRSIPSIAGSTITLDRKTYEFNIGQMRGDGEYIGNTPTVLAEGEYDWRWLCSIGRKNLNVPPGDPPYTKIRQTRVEHLLYWNPFSKWAGLPSGATATQLGDKIRELALEEEGIPLDTAFDVRIQAAVFAFRVSYNVPALLSALGWENFILWEREGAHAARIYNHTHYSVTFRQAMPCK